MPAPVYSSREFVKHFFTTEAVESRPTSWNVALHTGDPGKGDDNEVTAPSYQRKEISFSAELDQQSQSFWEAKNTQDVSFDQAGYDENYTVTHYTVRDGLSGECLAIGKLNEPLPVSEGTVVMFPQSYLKVRGV